MKPRVLAILVLFMVTGFVVNAFSAGADLQAKVLSTLNSLNSMRVQNDAGDEVDSSFAGNTVGRKKCEAVIANFKGQLSASVTWYGIGMQMAIFDQSKVSLTDFNDNGQKFVAIGNNKSNGAKQALVVETSNSVPRQLKSVELLEEQKGVFSGAKMVSVVKCQ